MAPGKQEIMAVLIKVLQDIQFQSGRPCPEIGERTRPIGHLDGFDSLNGLEATVELGARLGIEIPEDINLFVDMDASKALRIPEVVDQLVRLLSKDGES